MNALATIHLRDRERMRSEVCSRQTPPWITTSTITPAERWGERGGGEEGDLMPLPNPLCHCQTSVLNRVSATDRGRRYDPRTKLFHGWIIIDQRA